MNLEENNNILRESQYKRVLLECYKGKFKPVNINDIEEVIALQKKCEELEKKIETLIDVVERIVD